MAIETAFNKGLREVRAGELKEIQQEIKKALGVKSRQQYTKYRDGLMPLTVDRYAEIMMIFKQRGVYHPFGK